MVTHMAAARYPPPTNVPHPRRTMRPSLALLLGAAVGDPGHLDGLERPRRRPIIEPHLPDRVTGPGADARCAPADARGCPAGPARRGLGCHQRGVSTRTSMVSTGKRSVMSTRPTSSRPRTRGRSTTCVEEMLGLLQDDEVLFGSPLLVESLPPAEATYAGIGTLLDTGAPPRMTAQDRWCCTCFRAVALRRRVSAHATASSRWTVTHASGSVPCADRKARPSRWAWSHPANRGGT